MSQELKGQTVEGAQLIFDLKNDLIKKFKDGTFDKESLPIFFELIEVITDDKKLTIPWEKLYII